MAHTVLIHLINEDPILAEVEKLPDPTDNLLICTNPRRRDGKPLHYITNEATSFIFTWQRISFIEVMPSEAEEAEIVEFYRD